MSMQMDIYPKELPPDGLLLWRFIGVSNILMTNGEIWRKHSTIIRDGFNLRIPMDTFIHLSKGLFSIIGDKPDTTVCFSDLAQRFALDAVGSTVLGHDFNALHEDPHIVVEYNGVMSAIANPLYLIMPWMEKVFPRKAVLKRMDNLVERFTEMLKAKRNDPGDDVMTYMLKDPEMTDEHHRDNMVVLFIAGHVSFFFFNRLNSSSYFSVRKHPRVAYPPSSTTSPNTPNAKPKLVPRSSRP